ncbi:AraC family transcriptional regulator [Nocardioides sp. GXZ039]|uniref:AraC family transcriptional regulator n=1 Tax=Nocardioides sp. GXZ039 TaxID=3136018 RepID=UPI0030F39064
MARDLLTRFPVVATTELDVARERVADRYCPHGLSLARRGGRLDLVHNGTAVGRDVAVNYMAYGDEVRITPGRFTNFYLVQLPLRGRARVRCGSRELVADRHTAFVGSPEEPVDMRWSADCAKVVVYIRRSAVEELAAATDASDGHEKGSVVFDPTLSLDRPAVREWLQLLWLAIEQLEAGSGLLHTPLVATSYEQTLISALLAVQPNSAGTPASVDVPSRTVRAALALIEGDPARAWRIADLAAACGVSARTLQAAFHAELGTTPLAELRRIRMDAVRRDLLEADPLSTTVTTVASRWGFYHLGRFAQAYRDRFQELPSHTLAR